MPLSPRQIRGRSGQSRSQECGGEKEHVPGTSRSRSTIWPHNREIHLNLIYIHEWMARSRKKHLLVFICNENKKEIGLLYRLGKVQCCRAVE